MLDAQCTPVQPPVMNPTTEQPPPLQQPQQLQPHRSSFTCDRHPQENFTGFCPSCLCERLTTLDQSSASSSRRPSTSSATTSTAAAALKAIFKVPSTTTTTTTTEINSKSKIRTSFFPELRRTKSFSASKNEGLSGVFEPQRKSCDVRARNSLWSLFSLDDENKSSTQNLGGTGTVLEAKEEEEHEDHEDNYDVDEDDDEIRISEEKPNITYIDDEINNIVEVVEEDVKTMKDHIDLDSQAKKPSLAGFWSAASVFSEKWHKWRRKQKLKKRSDGGVSGALPVEKPISRQYRDTQSEIADYGYGRRSCDTDPRFSLDAGRISFDDPRYSYDEPRASWDGYLIGRTFPPRLPPMVEDAPVVNVVRSDTHILVEEPMNCSNAEENIPGGSTQTREYYSDSFSKRRKSLDKSNSARKTAAAVVAEIDETKAVSNAKVSPAIIDYIHGAKLGGERDIVRDSNSNSLRDDCSETFDLGFRDNGTVIGAGGEKKGSKKSRRWSWNIWGFIHRRGGGGNKDEEEERYSKVNGVERSLSESWQELRREGNGEEKGGFNRKVFRSNSSVSWRNSYNVSGSFGSSSVRKSTSEMNGNGNGNGIGNVKKRRDEFVLERNRSARYSPNDIDNGLLRLYLTPLRSSRRGGIGFGKSRSSNSHSIARSVLRLY